MIKPCRNIVTDRFPLASFVVNLDKGREYEVVCATSPTLFHPNQAKYRNPNNFYTSRSHGLLNSKDDTSTYLLPQSQLKRFSGNNRLYYALGSYGNKTGANPKFSISPADLDKVPSIQLAGKFFNASNNAVTNKATASITKTYGGKTNTNRPLMRWGGDDVLERAHRQAQEQSQLNSFGYDDGFDSELWSEGQTSQATSNYSNNFQSHQNYHQSNVNSHHSDSLYTSGDMSHDQHFREYNSASPAYPHSNQHLGVKHAGFEHSGFDYSDIEHFSTEQTQRYHPDMQCTMPHNNEPLSHYEEYSYEGYGNASKRQNLNTNAHAATVPSTKPPTQKPVSMEPAERYGSVAEYSTPEQSLPVGPASAPLSDNVESTPHKYPILRKKRINLRHNNPILNL